MEVLLYGSHLQTDFNGNFPRVKILDLDTDDGNTYLRVPRPDLISDMDPLKFVVLVLLLLQFF